MERLKKQMGFIVEVDKVKKIIRQTISCRLQPERK